MTAEHDTIHLAAADWVARLREPEVSLEETMAWQNWLGADPRHAEAFARMEEVSTVLHALPRPPRPIARSADRYHFWAGAIAASTVAAIIGFTWAMSSRGASVLQTAIGENRKVTLADGSSITLGGNTKLSVDLNDTARRIDLARGEAYFKVAKDRNRPFKVHAGDATVVAVGTEFNVRRGDDRVVVSVVEGRVIVEPETRILPIALLREFKPNFASIKLDAGQQTTAGGRGVEAATPLPDSTTATAWQTGRLAFRLEPLRYVLEDVNRYSPKPIVIEEERIASLRVTGTVVGNNVKGWIGSLESALGIEAVEEPERIVLRAVK
jgi:transmembrane sensor